MRKRLTFTNLKTGEKSQAKKTSNKLSCDKHDKNTEFCVDCFKVNFEA